MKNISFVFLLIFLVLSNFSMAQTKKEVIEGKGYPNPDFKYLVSYNDEDKTFDIYNVDKDSEISINVLDYIQKPTALWWTAGYEHIAIYDGGLTQSQIEDDPYLQQNVYIFSLKDGKLIKEIKQFKRSFGQFYIPIFVGNSYYVTFLPPSKTYYSSRNDKNDKNLYVYSLPDFKLINQFKIDDDTKEKLMGRDDNDQLLQAGKQSVDKSLLRYNLWRDYIWHKGTHNGYKKYPSTIDHKELIWAEFDEKKSKYTASYNYKSLNIFTGKIRSLSIDEDKKELQYILDTQNKTQYTPNYDIRYSSLKKAWNDWEGDIHLKKNGSERLVIKVNVAYARIDEQEEWLFVEMGRNLLIKLKYIREKQDWLCISGDCEFGQGRAIGIKEHNAGVRYEGKFYKGQPAK